MAFVYLRETYNRLSIKYFVISLLLFVSTSVFSTDINIKHRLPRDGQPLDKLIIKLVQFIGTEMELNFKLSEYDYSYAQGTRDDLLFRGDFDLDWRGVGDENVGKNIVIYYPILRGLIGQRLFIANKESHQLLKTSETLSDLLDAPIVQGKDWADVSILRSGGFTQITEPRDFESLFKMVESGRAAFFPRAAVEPYGELDARCNFDGFKCVNKDLLVDDSTLLVYKLPMLFIVSAKRRELADILNQFFQTKENEFFNFIDNNQTIKTIIRKLEGRKTYKINNQFKNPKMNSIPKQFWKDFS